MRVSLRLKSSLLAVCVGLMTLHVPVSFAAEEPPDQIDISKELLDEVMLPDGGEIISALESFGVKIYNPPPYKTKSTNKYKVALNLGLAVADGFASITSWDKNKLTQVARNIRDYGKVLNVKKSLLAKYNELTKAIEKDDREGIAILISEMRSNIEIELHEQRRKDEATLAVVAGWIEGMYIVSRSLDSSFNQNAADELLKYTDLPVYLNKNLGTLSTRVKKKKDVKAIITTLQKINKIVNKDTKVTRKDVKSLITITTGARRTIMLK